MAFTLAACGGGGGGGGAAIGPMTKAKPGEMHNGGGGGGWGKSPVAAPGFDSENGSDITSDEKLISQMAAIDNITSIRLDLIVNGKPQQTIVADANTTKDVLPPIKPEDKVSGTAYIYVAGEESPRIARLEETEAGLNKPLPFKVPYYYKAFDFSNTQVAGGTYYTRDGINLAEFTPDGYGWKCRQDGSVHAGPFVSGVRGDIELELVDASGRPAPKLYVKADFDASSPTSYTIDESLAQDFAAGATPAAGSGSVIITPLPAGTIYTETQSGAAVSSTGYHVTVTIDGTPFNINFSAGDTAAVPIINVPQGATITASASADITGGTGTTASLDLAGTASATMQPGGGTLTMYAQYPLTCQVSTAHMTNASISGTVPTFYTNTSPATTLPTATAQYTNVSTGKTMRFIGWALENNGTPVITGDTIPSTYKGALTLYACYGECSLTITGAALPATGSPVLAPGDTLALTAVPEGFPAGQTITYSWRVLPLGSAPATVSGSGANATVTPVAGASGSATVEVTATCGSLTASAMKNVTVVNLSVAGDTVIKKIDTGKTLTASLAGYFGSVDYTFTPTGSSITLGGSGGSRTITPVSGGKTTVRVTATTAEGKSIEKTVDVYVLNLVLGGSGLPANATDPIMLTDGSTETAALTASLEGISGGVTYSWSSSDTGVFTVSPSNTSATTITPVAAGSGTVTASLEYGGVTVQATRAVSVAGIQLTTCPDYFEKGATTGTSLMATLVGYSGSDVTWYPWTSENMSVATLSGASSGTTWSQSTISPLAGGKTKITVTATAGGRTFSTEKEIYVFDLVLSGGTSLSAPTPTNTNYGLMLTTNDTAGKTISASLAGTGMPSVTYTWTCIDSALNTIIMDDSNSTSGTFTVKPKAPGTASFSVMAYYNGSLTPVCTKTVDVAVAGLTLTGDSTHVFDSDPTAPAGANDIALTATLGGIAPGALTPAGITFVSDDPTIATVTAGSASGTSRPATVTALKGGKVTITATATIAATNTELTVTKEITIINIILKDSTNSSLALTGNILNTGSSMTLKAALEGIGVSGATYSWSANPVGSTGKVSFSSSSLLETASGTNSGSGTNATNNVTITGWTPGATSVTLTATYGGTDYEKTIGFRCPVFKMKTGSQINSILTSSSQLKAGNSGTARSFAASTTPPPSNATTYKLSANDSDVECLAWLDGTAIKYYAQGYTDTGVKIPLNADSGSMFSNCSSLTSIDVSGFDTSSVTKMSQMFVFCSNLTDITGLSGFDTSNVTDIQSMFSNCSSLTSLDVSNFDTGSVTTMYGMFYKCSSLSSLDVSNFDTGSVTNMSSMFYNCRGLTILDLSGFDTGSVTSMSYMFYGCSGLTILDVSGFDTGSVTNMSYMFEGCSSLTSLDVSDFNTSSVTNMYEMFEACSSLISLDVSGFDTGSVTDMSRMFYNCSSLTSLDVSNFNTGNVTNMGSMFYECSCLANLDVSSFNTSSVTDMKYMFFHCSGLTILDVSNFNTSSVTDMGNMFSNCSNLITIFASAAFDTASVTSSSNMFSGSTSLQGGNGTTYNSSHKDKEYARIDDPTNGRPGYFTQKP